MSRLSEQYLEWDTSRNESSFGLVTLPNFPSSARQEFEYSQSQENENIHILISKFGNEEYECRGSCFCDESTRRGSTVISRGLFYLTAATSSVLAVQLASEHFHEKCSEIFEETCDEESIISEVEECEQMEPSMSAKRVKPVRKSFKDRVKEELERRKEKGENWEVTEVKKKKKKKTETKTKKKKKTEYEKTRPLNEPKREYFCTGGCRARQIWDEVYTTMKRRNKRLTYAKGSIGKVKLEQLAKEMDVKYIESRIKLCENMRLALFIITSETEPLDVRDEFIENRLEPYCEGHSPVPSMITSYFDEGDSGFIGNSWCIPSTWKRKNRNVPGGYTSTTFCKKVDDELFDYFLENYARTNW